MRIRQWMKSFIESKKDNKLVNFNYLYDIVNDIKTGTENDVKIIRDIINNEKKLRLQQAKRIDNKINKAVEQVNANFSKVNECISKINDTRNSVNKKIGETLDRMDKGLSEFYSIEKLCSKASKEYQYYLNQLKVDISTFKKNDMAVERLARLEARMTLMEIKDKEINPHGSSSTVSG